MALDRGGVTRPGFDDVGVDRALGQEVHGADLLSLFLEHADELLAYGLSLDLRICDPSESL